MRYPSAGTWLVVVGGGLLAGCQTGQPRHAYARDPLVLSRMPVEGKPGPVGAPKLLTQAEPAPPVMPASEVVQGPSARPTESVSGPAPPTEPSSAPPAKPKLVETAPQEDLIRTSGPPAPARHTEYLYGHASDYTWLHGVLDRHYIGHLTLRYCDFSIEDTWGGKVILDDDPRLAEYHDGDVVEVEGELIPASPAMRHSWDQNPHYRIQSIRLAERKSP